MSPEKKTVDDRLLLHLLCVLVCVGRQQESSQKWFEDLRSSVQLFEHVQ